MVYQPREDSYLLESETKKYIDKLKNKDIKILDMGSGSGIQAKICLKSGIKKIDIFTVDIDPIVIKNLKKQGFKAKKSDLFSNMKNKEKFDLILFNPPYLPLCKYDDSLTNTGGKKGYETILKFLKQAKKYLNKDGAILLLISSLSKPSIIKQKARKNYQIRKLNEKKFFFEKLEIWKLRYKK